MRSVPIGRALLFATCLLGASVGGGPAAASTLTPVAVLTVTTTADVVNGDVSSPAALVAHPGRDGISLREAILASDHAGGRHAITFSPSLAGRTITPSGFLPEFTRDHISLVGLVAKDGSPAITLNARNNAKGCCTGLLAVYASDIAISHLRIVGIRGGNYGVVVFAEEPGGERHISDVRIEASVFDGGGQAGSGVRIGTDFPGYLMRQPGVKGQPAVLYPGAAGATLRRVRLAHNVFRRFAEWDAVDVGLPGTGNSIEGLVIDDNAFANNGGQESSAIELGLGFYRGNTITGTEIARNSFTANEFGIMLLGGISGSMNGGAPPPVSGNTLSGTVISQNVFDGNQLAIGFVAGGAGSLATDDAVLDTEISNNLIVRSDPWGAIDIQGGQGGTGNRVDGVRIVNDTIAFNNTGISVVGGDAGDVVSNVEVRNTIVWHNLHDFNEDVAPPLTSSLVGIDPLFVSAQDFHLQPGSPAINAGTAGGAPTVDITGSLRDSQPDIGAYEFGALPRPLLSVLVDDIGGSGTITSRPSGISCGWSCDAVFGTGTKVVLVPSPASGSRFLGWSGACSGTRGCSVTVAHSTLVTARFGPRS